MSEDKIRILIADDEPLYLRTTGELLRKAGYECVCVPTATEAMQRLHTETFDLVLSDLNMPGNKKLELLQHQSRTSPEIPLIVITGVPTLPTAIESIRLGITDYLLKPVKYEDLLASVRRALISRRRFLSSKPRLPRSHQELGRLFPKIIGRSPPMLELFEVIDRVASTDTNILITGESGTGKEVIAQTIHMHSHRKEGNFQVIDCTAVPESLFESMLFGHKKGSFTGAIHDAEGLLKQCDSGTAFIDELGELPAPMQAKLLRAVQEQTFTPVGSHSPVSVNTRFICATNRDLEMEVKAGRFREDLFYRLGVIHIELPPLRTRGNDIVLLAEYFLEALRLPGSPAKEFSGDAIHCLQHYHWPGNIRELRNVIERAIALTCGEQIVATDLPKKIQIPRAESLHESHDRVPDAASEERLGGECATDPTTILSGVSRDQALEAAEYQYLVNLMKSRGGNISEAARHAGISRQAMHKLLRKHDIHATEFRH